MINTYTYKKLTWVDLESPTQDEVRQIMDTYQMDPFIAQDLLIPTLKPRITVTEKSIYMVMRFPVSRLSHNKKNGNTQEIDFYITKDHIITARYDTIDPLHKFSKTFEVNSILDKGNMGSHAGYIFFFMLQYIYTSINNELEAIDDSLRRIEDDIFAQREKEMVFELSRINRDLLDFKKAFSSQKNVISEFTKISHEFFDHEYRKCASELFGEFEKIHAKISDQIELLNELRSTNDSLLSTRQNEIMKFFTVISFIVFPLELLVSLLEFSSPSNPFLEVPNNFFIVVGIVIFSSITMMALFKKEKWI